MTDTGSRVLTTESIYRGRTFNVDVDRVVLPDGRTVRMEVVRHPGSVVLLAMPAPGRVVLIRQYRYVVGRWIWELPAGGIDPGETPEAAARRECHEELGQIPEVAEAIGTLLPTPGYSDESMAFYRLTGLRNPLPTDPTAAQDADELLEAHEMTLEEARRMVRDGSIVDLKTAFGLSLA